MNKSLVVIVDADAIIAQVNPEDKHHEQALKISSFLISNNAQVMYPITAVAESNAFIQRPLNSTASAYGTAVVFANPNVHIEEVNQQTLKTAVEYFSPTASKKDTLFDCIVAAVAKEHKADAIFSFDKFYKKKGFKLASDLIEE